MCKIHLLFNSPTDAVFLVLFFTILFLCLGKLFGTYTREKASAKSVSWSYYALVAFENVVILEAVFAMNISDYTFLFIRFQ